MGKGLVGKTVAIAGSRKTEEMSTLIEKQGGTAVVRSLQGTVFLADKEVEPDLKTFIENGADWVILTTGIGTETLLEVATNMKLRERFLNTLSQARIASRGYKTFGVLKRLGLKPVAVDEDGTTDGVIQAIKEYDFSGKTVMVQLHGDNAPRLISFLHEKGASVLQLLPYQHVPPDERTVKLLCDEIVANKVDAICFTTAIQVRSLIKSCKKQGNHSEILECFKNDVLAVAVGKVTAEALREEGINRYISPSNERMGAMIVELANYYEQNQN